MAWGVVDSILKGTLDEDYPIMKKSEKDVTILGGEDTIELQPGEAATDNVISADFPEDNVYAADTVSLDQSWWENDGHSLVGNPYYAPAGDDTITFTGVDSSVAAADTVSFTGSRLWGGMGEDHISFGGLAGTHYDDPKYYAGVDSLSFNTKPQPDLKGPGHRKYQEDKGLRDLSDYVSSTYNGHYTNDGSNVQTLDLIHSVGDAESFCRSNAIKYLSRYDKKGQAKRDILKAMHYCLLLYYFSGNTNDEITTRGYETF